MTELAHLDPFDPDVVQEPHAFYAALRREAPLYRLPNGAYYLISRYRDVRDAAMDLETYSSNLVAVMMQGQERPELLSLSGGGGTGSVDALAIADPPVHTRQRKLSNKAFSMRRVAALEPQHREEVDPGVHAREHGHPAAGVRTQSLRRELLGPGRCNGDHLVGVRHRSRGS